MTSGRTGHLEAVEITFNPSQVSRERLLYMFVRSIDPTDGGGQFCDRGQSYASAIFVNGSAQEAEAKKLLSDAGAKLDAPIATKILPKSNFWPAGAEHQDYYKSSERVITRFGVRKKSDAYKRYRKACGRDARVKQLWGSEAPFAK